jgi:hypothetical protein
MNSGFRPHGRFKVWTDGQLLISEMTGPWNRELVEYWAAQALQLTGEFSNERPYIAITTVYESILCPADAMERIAKAIEYSHTHLPCLANVVVAAEDVDGRGLVKSAYQRIGLENFFTELESAKDWAQKTLATHNSKFKEKADLPS